MPSANSDRNLLFGFLALQMDFINRDALIAAMHAWVLDKARPLGEILVELGALKPGQRVLLEPLLLAYLQAHGDDLPRSLAALPVAASLRQQLHNLAAGNGEAMLDPAPTVSLSLIPANPDPNGTQAETLPPAGASTSAPTCGPSFVLGYEILGELGRGGMGVVYKARQLAANRLVALKMILIGGYAAAADLARFRSEAQAVARLQHPGIVQVFEVGQRPADGGNPPEPFFSLEFVDGGSLDKKLNGTPLPPREAARLIEQVAEAVHAAHRQHIIHRDLKPANILLTSDGQPKVTDFGLAKTLDVERGQTATGAVMGTPSYMAPEQAGGRSKEIGPATDVYALGAVLYECLTGRPPFRAATPLDTILQAMSDDPVPLRQLQPSVPRDLETICLTCLRKEPARR